MLIHLVGACAWNGGVSETIPKVVDGGSEGGLMSHVLKEEGQSGVANVPKLHVTVHC